MMVMVVMMRIRWIKRIRWIIPGIAPIIARISPIIWGIAVIWIPIRIPTVVIWPAKTKTCAKLNSYTRFGRFLNDINCIDDALDGVDFNNVFTLFGIDLTGVEITII